MRRFNFGGFRPTMIPNLGFWGSSGVGVILGGSSKVSAWNDRGPLLRHLTQANPTYYLDYVPNVLNGFPAIRADGTANKTLGWNGGLGFNQTTDFTVFIVCSVVDAAINYRMLMCTVGNTINLVFRATGPQLYPGAVWGSAILNTPMVVCFRRTASLTAVSVNGATEVTSATAGTLDKWGGLNYSGSWPFKGDVFEVVLVESDLILASAENQQMRHYLGDKYAITVS